MGDQEHQPCELACYRAETGEQGCHNRGFCCTHSIAGISCRKCGQVIDAVPTKEHSVVQSLPIHKVNMLDNSQANACTFAVAWVLSQDCATYSHCWHSTPQSVRAQESMLPGLSESSTHHILLSCWYAHDVPVQMILPSWSHKT